MGKQKNTFQRFVFFLLLAAVLAAPVVFFPNQAIGQAPVTPTVELYSWPQFGKDLYNAGLAALETAAYRIVKYAAEQAGHGLAYNAFKDFATLAPGQKPLFEQLPPEKQRELFWSEFSGGMLEGAAQGIGNAVDSYDNRVRNNELVSSTAEYENTIQLLQGAVEDCDETTFRVSQGHEGQTFENWKTDCEAYNANNNNAINTASSTLAAQKRELVDVKQRIKTSDTLSGTQMIKMRRQNAQGVPPLSDTARNILSVLCRPTASFSKSILLNFAKVPQLQKPLCDWKDLSEGWKDMYDHTGIQELVEGARDNKLNPWLALQQMMNPNASEVDAEFRLYSNWISEGQAKFALSQQDKALWGGVKNVRDFTGNVLTPGKFIAGQVDKSLASSAEAKTRPFITGKFIVDMVDVFATFADTLIGKSSEFLNEGIAKRARLASLGGENGGYGGQFSSEFSIGVGSVDNYQSQAYEGGVAAVEARLASIKKLDFSNDAEDLDILSKLSVDSSCSSNQNYCVIGRGFAEAVRAKMTVEEAVAKYVGSSQVGLNPNGVFGFLQNGTEPDYKTNFPYSSLVILRKYRIVPVSWELAALYIRHNHGACAASTGGECTLSFLLTAFDDPASPFYRLVDPAWLLKSPAYRCYLKGLGPTKSMVSSAGGGDAPPGYSCKSDTNGDGKTCCTVSCLTEEDKHACTTPAVQTCFVDETETVNTICRATKTDGVTYVKNDLDRQRCYQDAEQTRIRCIAKASNFTTNPALGPCLQKQTPSPLDAYEPNDMRQETCVDERSCLDDNGSGGCDSAKYGYCLEEKKVVRFAGTQCKEQFASCQRYVNQESGEEKFYLKDSLPATPAACTGDVRGCQQYSTTRLIGAARASGSPLITKDWSSAGADQAYLASAARAPGHTCSAEAEGCRSVEQASFALRIAPPELQCDQEVGGMPGYKRDECKRFALHCSAQDVGCLSYQPTNGDPRVAGTNPALCPAACAGFASFVQDATYFEQGAPSVLFAPATVSSCSQQSVGCDEFTNLDAASQGGEKREYFTQLQACQSTPAASDPQSVFYSWFGSDGLGGVRLQTYSLVTTTSTLAGDSTTLTGPRPQCSAGGTTADCVCAKGDQPNAQGGTCREFINIKGELIYRWTDKIVYYTNDCHPYRRTLDDATAQPRLASAGMSQACSASAATCRAYRGPTAGDIRRIFLDDFREKANTLWVDAAANPPAGSVGVSNDTETLLDNSLLAKTETIRRSGITLAQGASYMLSFTIKASADATVAPTFEGLGQSGNQSAAPDGTADEKAPVLQGGAWKRVAFSFTALGLQGGANKTLQIAVHPKAGTTPPNFSFTIDNILLNQTPGVFYKLKSSVNLFDANSCKDAATSVPYFGCQQYTGKDGATSFTTLGHVCANEVVGCRTITQSAPTTVFFDTFSTASDFKGWTAWDANATLLVFPRGDLLNINGRVQHNIPGYLGVLENQIALAGTIQKTVAFQSGRYDFIINVASEIPATSISVSAIIDGARYSFAKSAAVACAAGAQDCFEPLTFSGTIPSLSGAERTGVVQVEFKNLTTEIYPLILSTTLAHQKTRYLVEDKNKQCNLSDDKCTAYGIANRDSKGTIIEIVEKNNGVVTKRTEQWNTVYLKITPDDIARKPQGDAQAGICRQQDVGCSSYENGVNFKDPGKKVCMYNDAVNPPRWEHSECTGVGGVTPLTTGVACTRDEDCAGVHAADGSLITASLACTGVEGCNAAEYVKACPANQNTCRRITDPACDAATKVLKTNYGRDTGPTGEACEPNYYYLQDIANNNTECTANGGKVDVEKGCILVHDEAVSNTNVYNSTKFYEKYFSTSTARSIPVNLSAEVNGTGTPDANTLMKVKYDRVCKTFLACTQTQDGSCQERRPCTKLAPDGSCLEFPYIHTAGNKTKLPQLVPLFDTPERQAFANRSRVPVAINYAFASLSGLSRPDLLFNDQFATSGGHDGYFDWDAALLEGGTILKSVKNRYELLERKGGVTLTAASDDTAIKGGIQSHLAGRSQEDIYRTINDVVQFTQGKVPVVYSDKIVPSCRLYPEQDSPDNRKIREIVAAGHSGTPPADVAVNSCSYSRNLQQFQGIPGYCLEPYPNRKVGDANFQYEERYKQDSINATVYGYKNYCLNWLPVDTIKGKQPISKDTPPEAPADSHDPTAGTLEYCLAKNTVDYSYNIQRQDIRSTFTVGLSSGKRVAWTTGYESDTGFKPARCALQESMRRCNLDSEMILYSDGFDTTTNMLNYKIKARNIPGSPIATFKGKNGDWDVSIDGQSTETIGDTSSVDENGYSTGGVLWGILNFYNNESKRNHSRHPVNEEISHEGNDREIAAVGEFINSHPNVYSQSYYADGSSGGEASKRFVGPYFGLTQGRYYWKTANPGYNGSDRCAIEGPCPSKQENFSEPVKVDDLEELGSMDVKIAETADEHADGKDRDHGYSPDNTLNAKDNNFGTLNKTISDPATITPGNYDVSFQATKHSNNPACPEETLCWKRIENSFFPFSGGCSFSSYSNNQSHFPIVRVKLNVQSKEIWWWYCDGSNGGVEYFNDGTQNLDALDRGTPYFQSIPLKITIHQKPRKYERKASQCVFKASVGEPGDSAYRTIHRVLSSATNPVIPGIIKDGGGHTVAVNMSQLNTTDADNLLGLPDLDLPRIDTTPLTNIFPRSYLVKIVNNRLAADSPQLGRDESTAAHALIETNDCQTTNSRVSCYSDYPHDQGTTNIAQSETRRSGERLKNFASSRPAGDELNITNIGGTNNSFTIELAQSGTISGVQGKNFPTLKFFTNDGADYLPLRKISVNWGDGTPEVAEYDSVEQGDNGRGMQPRKSGSAPHTYTHAYDDDAGVSGKMICIIAEDNWYFMKKVCGIVVVNAQGVPTVTTATGDKAPQKCFAPPRNYSFNNNAPLCGL